MVEGEPKTFDSPLKVELTKNVYNLVFGRYGHDFEMSKKYKNGRIASRILISRET